MRKEPKRSCWSSFVCLILLYIAFSDDAKKRKNIFSMCMFSVSEKMLICCFRNLFSLKLFYSLPKIKTKNILNINFCNRNFTRSEEVETKIFFIIISDINYLARRRCFLLRSLRRLRRFLCHFGRMPPGRETVPIVFFQRGVFCGFFSKNTFFFLL